MYVALSCIGVHDPDVQNTIIGCCYCKAKSEAIDEMLRMFSFNFGTEVILDEKRKHALKKVFESGRIVRLDWGIDYDIFCTVLEDPSEQQFKNFVSNIVLEPSICLDSVLEA